MCTCVETNVRYGHCTSYIVDNQQYLQSAFIVLVLGGETKIASMLTLSFSRVINFEFPGLQPHQKYISHYGELGFS